MVDYIDKLAAVALANIPEAHWVSKTELGCHFHCTPPSAEQLAHTLRSRPALQAILASRTGYTPSKWLLMEEFDELAERRTKVPMDDLDENPDAYQRAAKSGLMGLCLSGGGIRSATFNLGVLQGLAELRLLDCFDYLSSVSGGGYIHQWLAAWASRESFPSVAEKLVPLPDERCPQTHPEPLRWLRRYSNYLTPQLGLFSGDTWVMAATWIRNTLLNQSILIASLLALVLVPHLLFRIQLHPGPRAAVAFGILFALLIAATWYTGRNLHQCDLHTASPSGVLGQTGVQLSVVGPLLLASVVASMLFPLAATTAFGLHLGVSVLLAWVLLMLLSVAVTFGGDAILCYLQSRRGTEEVRSFREFWKHLHKGDAIAVSFPPLAGFVVASAVSATAGAAWIGGSEYLLARLWHLSPGNWYPIVLTLGPPLLVNGVLVSLVLLTGLLGRAYFNARREWLARLSGWAGFVSVAWIAFIAITLLSHSLLVWAIPHVKTVTGLLLGWAGTTVGGIFAANGRGSSGAKDDQQPRDSKVSELISVVAPYIFIVGLLILVSLLAEFITRGHGARWVLVEIASSGAVALLLAWRVDINEFSMHAFYRDRLARCYLGASNRSRAANPFTGFDDWDTKLPLDSLRPTRGYHGPFPIFCAALNLTFGEDLAWQERKAASFAFTPLYCGYDVPWTAATAKPTEMRFNGFVRTQDFAYPRPGIHLPTVAAISGAAVSPNMGYHSNPATAFLMTVFNVRLGWWLANPRKLTEGGRLLHSTRSLPGLSGSHYPSSSPLLSLLYLASELLGQTDDTRRYVYLSDGGHFDNMGLYELVRRRCRYIVICDAEADGQLQFEGIGMAIRKCRIDFGAEITLDLRPLAKNGDGDNSSAHCVTGSIRYPEDDRATPPGIVVYVKSSLTGDEPADVLNYKKQDSVFPQDSTNDQWFSESQFESYRRLGHHIATATFAAADPVAFSCREREGRAGYFSNLSKIWAPMTPQMKEFSPQHTALYGELLEETRTDSTMSGLFDLLFDRAAAGTRKWKDAPTDVESAYAARFCLRFIEFIFTVYLQLRLMYPENREHPFAQGWLEIFSSWGKIDVMQSAWKRYGCGYTRGFQLFLESEGIGFPSLRADANK